MKRAKYSMGALVAVTISSQLIMYGMPIKIAVYFRPILSANKPAGTAPTNAPMARNDAIHVSVNEININFNDFLKRFMSK